MPHEHNDHCGHETHEHDHDESAELGFQDNLFLHIDQENAVVLNSDQKASNILKPWHQRLEENKFVESDADAQLIIRVPFTGSVRLRAILLKSGPGDQTPTEFALFPNEGNLDFDDIADKKPTQVLPVPQGRDVGEYAVKVAKFSNVSSITLFIPASQGADTSRIYYLGFLGSWTAAKQQPIITVYEAQANLADHEKIQGTDGNWSTPGL